LSSLLWASEVSSQGKAENVQKAAEEQPIRISTELVQLDVVVTDKSGRVVKDLGKAEFELYENGKKQHIDFFEFVEAGKRRGPEDSPQKPRIKKEGEDARAKRASETDVRRIFAFVIDDLTIRNEDLVNIREMLTNFVDNQMTENDLVAIVRTVGGKGLLQQFTMDKGLLRRAIGALAPSSHALSVFHNPDPDKIARPRPLGDAGNAPGSSESLSGAAGPSGAENLDISSANDDANKALRAYMSLGTASFVIDTMKSLPGRKTMVLVSGGLPILSSTTDSSAGNVANFLNSLSDKATRAGVAISTMDVRGLQAYTGVASFEDTPGKSAMDTNGMTSPRRLGTNPTINRPGGGFGRTPDDTLFGDKNPFDEIEAHQGLRTLAAATGGMAVLERNDFNSGLSKIVNASEGYYLLAYTPANPKFGGEFRKVEVRVKGTALKVYSRRGYLARQDEPEQTAPAKQNELLAAIKSPLARREIDLDAVVLYKGAPASKGDDKNKSATAAQGAVDIQINTDPGKLHFEQVSDKHQAGYEVAGFVFDQFGKLRGGFSETVTASLSAEEFAKASKTGLSYSASTVLPAGIYQIRLAVRDLKSGGIGTLSRYMEIPDLSKGHLVASSLLLGAAPAGDMKSTDIVPLAPSKRVSRKQDLRYAVVIYNSKFRDGKPLVQTELIVSKDGRPIFRDSQAAQTLAKEHLHVIKVGQLGLARVAPGRYTMTIQITDPAADKRSQTITRMTDFVVVD